MREKGAAKDGGNSTTAGRPARAGAIDLLAFLAVLTFVVVLVLVHVQLAYAGIAGLAIGCTTVWTRLRVPRRRRWQSGQFVYRGRNISIVSAWGVEGQAAPAVETPAGGEPPAPAPGIST